MQREHATWRIGYELSSAGPAATKRVFDFGGQWDQRDIPTAERVLSTSFAA